MCAVCLAILPDRVLIDSWLTGGVGYFTSKSTSPIDCTKGFPSYEWLTSDILFRLHSLYKAFVFKWISYNLHRNIPSSFTTVPDNVDPVNRRTPCVDTSPSFDWWCNWVNGCAPFAIVPASATASPNSSGNLQTSYTYKPSTKIPMTC